MQNEITFAGLYRQIGEMRSNGIDIKDAEVGPETWKVILKAANADPKNVIEGWFAGIHVVSGRVPEGKIWPK